MQIVTIEQPIRDLIDQLHNSGFRVRAWWVPGVAEDHTNLYDEHSNWFYTKAIPSWGSSDETGDWYLNPTRSDVRAWNRNIVERLVGYGFDGFKLDDIYEIISDDPAMHREYSELISDIYTRARGLRSDFAVNICNCGIAQNFFQFRGQNQLITSDPINAKQMRLRGKYLHALNVGNAAILGDHIELTQGDIGPDDLQEASFYRRVTDADFASVVALGMVLQTKFTLDPGDRYRIWFQLYREHKLYEANWVNLPYFAWHEIEPGESLATVVNVI